jgi:hypothetical protein
MNPSTNQYIDLDRFPFVPSGTPEWQRLVDIHKNALEANGASIMKGVIKQDILNRMAREADIVLQNLMHAVIPIIHFWIKIIYHYPIITLAGRNRPLL